MKKLLVLLLSSALYGQVAQYPGAVVTDSQLMVAKNLLTAKLVTPLSPTATSLVVDSNVGFTANMLVTVDVEIIKISGIVGSNVLTVDALGRGFDGSTAIAHPIGKQVSVFLDAWHHMAVTAELKAIEQTLGNNMSNVPGSPSGGNVPVNKGGTGASTGPNALTALGVVYPTPVGQGGTGVGLAQGNGTKVQLSSGATTPNDCVKFDATGNTIDSGLPCNTLPSASAQLQYLRIAPNMGNLTTSQFAAVPTVSALDYNYPAQTPNVTLTATVGALVTLIPCPLGVNATDTRLRFWITGGTGTAESVASTGSGTCTSGLVTGGTVAFTPANTHTGAWTISSSHAGIYEAVAANPYREVRVPAGIYVMRDCMTFDPNKALILRGDGYDPAGISGTILAFAAVTSSANCANLSAISVYVTPGFPINPITIRDMLIVGNGAATPVINGLSFTNLTRVSLDGVMVSGFAANGVFTSNCFEVFIGGRSYIQDNGNWGASINGTANLVKVSDTYFAFNSRANGFGNLAIQGNAAPNISTSVILQGNALEGAGQFPFTTVTVAFGAYFSNTSSLTLIGNYIESNLGGSPSTQVIYALGITGLTEIGNTIGSAGSTVLGGILYGADTKSVVSHGNTFYGAGTTVNRTFLATDLSTYVIGPDACFNGATECTLHPHSVGNIGLNPYTFATLPAVALAGTQIYCTNCTTAATCAGAGTGHQATSNGSTWVCN